MAIKQSVDGQGRAILTILPSVDSLAALSFRQPSFRPSFSSCLPHAHRLLRAHRPAPSISSFQPFHCPSPDRASLLFVLPRQPPASLAPRILRRPRPPSIGFHHSPRSSVPSPCRQPLPSSAAPSTPLSPRFPPLTPTWVRSTALVSGSSAGVPSPYSLLGAPTPCPPAQLCPSGAPRLAARPWLRLRAPLSRGK